MTEVSMGACTVWVRPVPDLEDADTFDPEWQPVQVTSLVVTLDEK